MHLTCIHRKPLSVVYRARPHSGHLEVDFSPEPGEMGLPGHFHQVEIVLVYHNPSGVESPSGPPSPRVAMGSVGHTQCETALISTTVGARFECLPVE
jgi:hypothetical protein